MDTITMYDEITGETTTEEVFVLPDDPDEAQAFIEKKLKELEEEEEEV